MGTVADAVRRPGETQGCIFCAKPQAGDDRAAHIVHRGALAYVMLNAYPYNNGHTLVAPFAHLSCLEDLPPRPSTR